MSSDSGMMLCLGSGKTPRYKANTLQLLAMPAGCHVQFRYSADIVEADTRKKLDEYAVRSPRFYTHDSDTPEDEPWREFREDWRERLHDEFEEQRSSPQRALLAHVDISDGGRQGDGCCRVVPCRFANLVEARKIDDFYILVFRLSDFAIASDERLFQQSLPNSIPHWASSEAIEGYWCQVLRRPPVALDDIRDTNGWVRCVDQLRTSTDFSKQPYFYNIEGIFGSDRRRKCRPNREGSFELAAANDYELSLFHYDPDADFHTGNKDPRALTVNSSSNITLRSSSRLAIDSPYDLKVVRFSTGAATKREFAFLSLKRTEPESDSSDLYPELYFPVVVRGSVAMSVVNGLILGALLSAQAGLAILARASPSKWLIEGIVAVVLGLCTGLFVSFGMKKPLS